MIPLADRTALISESITLAVGAKAKAMQKQGIDVVLFGAGEPAFDTPAFIKDAAKAALDKGQTKYTPTPCLPELRQAIAEKFNRENNLPYKPDQITTGAGGKHCLYMAFMAVLNPGDEVIIPSPYWVSYPEQVKLAGGVAKVVRGEEANGFKITPQQLEQAITPRTKGFIINSPSNPPGHRRSDRPAGRSVRRADAAGVREARPAHVASAERIAESHLRPPARRVLLLPQRFCVFRQIGGDNEDHRCRQLRRRPAGAES